MWASLAMVVGVSLALACSSSGDSVTGECSAGATRACACAGGGGDGAQVCSPSGFWRTCACGACPVSPTCEGKLCGADDGCGNACLIGSCASGQSCIGGVCKSGACSPKCAGKRCGDPDECGSVCLSGPCAQPEFSCVAGKCECKPVCTTCGNNDGCGGTCKTGACGSAGFTCSAGTCAVDPTSRWVVTVTNGTIPIDRSWNTFSAPDAMVCLWIGGKRLCTQDASDTLSPTWGCAFPAVTASTLMSGLEVEMFDNDRSGVGSCAENVTAAPGEAICARGTVAVTADNFRTKTWTAGCTSGMRFNATLTPL